MVRTIVGPSRIISRYLLPRPPRSSPRRKLPQVRGASWVNPARCSPSAVPRRTANGRRGPRIPSPLRPDPPDPKGGACLGSNPGGRYRAEGAAGVVPPVRAEGSPEEICWRNRPGLQGPSHGNPRTGWAGGLGGHHQALPIPGSAGNGSGGGSPERMTLFRQPFSAALAGPGGLLS